MASDAFIQLDSILESGDAAGALDFLAARFYEEKEFHLLFEARLMKKRAELDLPLIQTADSSTFPEAKRAAYEKGMVEAARETGGLYLADGKISRAWPYFRAIGENGPVIEAMQGEPAEDEADGVISIAIQEGLDPFRGLELMLAKHGMCRALTSFGMYGIQKDREKCITLLAQNLHKEILERMTRAIQANEAIEVASNDLCILMAGREWLFGEFDYYVDTSHLVTLIPYCLEVTESGTLEMFQQFCEYGKKLGSNFQVKGQPPFENLYVDYGEYVQAALGNEVGKRIAHFRRISEETDPDYVGNGPLQFLVKLLVKFGHFDEALKVSLSGLHGEGGDDCPSSLQLCRMAGNYEKLGELAKHKGDTLSYAAAAIESPTFSSKPSLRHSQADR